MTDGWRAGRAALWIGITHRRLGESKCIRRRPYFYIPPCLRGALCLCVSPRSRLALALALPVSSAAAILTLDSCSLLPCAASRLRLSQFTCHMAALANLLFLVFHQRSILGIAISVATLMPQV